MLKSKGKRYIITVSLPAEVGLTSQAVNRSDGLTLRDLLIAASEPRTEESVFATILGNGIDSYVPGVLDQQQVTVRTITFQADPNLTSLNTPIVINGATGTGELDANNPDRQEALVIDVSNLPSGTVLNLNNVEFAIIIGAGIFTGGNGQNFVIGDSANQFIVLGPEDDVLRGGTGEDTVASKDGNDKLYGDDGNDTIVGGVGDDSLYGGNGNDILQGGASDAGTWKFVLDSKGQMQVRFTPEDTRLTDIKETTISGIWTLPAELRGKTDSRFAIIEQDYATLEDVSLLFRAVVGRLPTQSLLNDISNLGLSSRELTQGAYDYFVAQNPVLQTQSIEEQVHLLVTKVWGETAKTIDEIVPIGTEYITNGGNWADAMLYLAEHQNNRNKLIDKSGMLQLTSTMTLGETGWSENSGDDKLFGGDGNDLLVGGNGNNILNGGKGIDMARFVGSLNDYTISIQKTAIGAIIPNLNIPNDMVIKNLRTGKTNIW